MNAPGGAIAPAGETGGGARRRALLVTKGGFSHINDRFITALRSVRPDLAIEVFDVTAALRRDRGAIARCLASVLREYGPSSLRSRAVLRHRFQRTRAFLREVERLLAGRLQGGAFDFTIQTQSLFSAARGDRPHFIYTDHVARAREGDDQDKLGRPTDAWLKRERGFYHSATHVFTFGPKIRQLLIDEYGVPPEKVSAVGAGASVMPTRPVDTSLERYARRNILFVGVEWERKGGPDLVAAFAMLRKDLPDATLTIVGCKPEVAVEGCRALGRLPPEEVEQHFHAASCFCMPSRLEPFGVVFTEAMQFGVPVVATDVSDIKSIVRQGETGVLVDAGDVAGLAQALRGVLEHPARCRDMGRRALGRAKLFTWEAVAGRVAAHLPGAEVAPFAAGALW